MRDEPFVTKSGKVLTDADIQALADEAEKGYDTSHLKQRQEMDNCVFCRIVSGDAPADIVWEREEFMAFRPLGPVTPGHLLVIPKRHVRDALEDPAVTGLTMMAAASIAEHPCNIITSAGIEATQSIFHLHIHVVPRREGDFLKLPWGTP